ncbi:hypothetical protein MVEN_00126200 [Mycena venus]|uniref:Secreted protein n=1 Tax=Mycena venus TaxID=2733690 RepID=A0A8H6Z973_9AGAR|nr:hypothetical protein MVEN_00126200 [Mycena venus]
MARIILSLVSVMLTFEVMAAPLTRCGETGDGTSNVACNQLVSPVQTNTLAATNVLGDINPSTDLGIGAPRLLNAQLTLLQAADLVGPLVLGFLNEAASESGNTSVADVLSTLQSAQSAMSGVTAGAFGENAKIRNVETTVKLMQGNQNITQAISQAQKALAANCTTA